jgi:O-antigen biosynthesis protein
MEKIGLEYQIKRIKDSGLFDAEYYREKYPEDLRSSNLDPVEHYIILGAKLGYNPSSSFNTTEYLEKNPELVTKKINPLIDYILNNTNNNSNSSLSAEEEDDIQLLKKSSEFDEEFYRTEYKKYIRNTSLDPAEHYLKYGWKLGLDPSKEFSTNEYLREHCDVSESKINPLVHYLRHGKKEKRKAGIRKKTFSESHLEEDENFIELKEIISILSANKNQKNSFADSITPIVLPIYKNFDLVKICIESILENTRVPFHLILIDDASNDDTLDEYLSKIANNNKNVTLIKNKQNLGFIKSVNSAIPLLEDDFVLINSDVEVPPGWLERLLYPIKVSPQIASTTPFTNSGTICSFPDTLVDNPLFEGHSLLSIDRRFQILGNQRYVEIPTGVGFCMGFSKQVVDKIGFFDEKTFGKGYGEENDWCLRAFKAGFRNILVPNLFVYHKHGGSFSTKEKEYLLKENLSKLNNKHPEYNKLVSEYIENDPLDSTRALITALLISDLPRPSTLVLDHSVGGGANFYCNEKINEMIKNDEIVLLFTFDNDQRVYLKLYYGKRTLKFVSDDLTEVKLFIRMLSIKNIFLNNIYFYEDPLDIISFISSFKSSHPHVKLTIPVHDYYSICPNLSLYDENMKCCDASTDNSKCLSCIRSKDSLTNKTISSFPKNLRDQIVKHGISHWRLPWKKLLAHCDEILCFSEDSKRIISKVYEGTAQKIQVTPHKITYLKKRTPSSSLNIGIIGNINECKGRGIIEEMLALIEENSLDVNIVLLGRTSEPVVSKHFIDLGPYSRNDLATRLSLLKIDIFFISSIWPETFSYTTEELMLLGYTVACFDIGAPAERLRNYPGGIIIPEVNAELALMYLINAVEKLRMASKPKEHAESHNFESHI